MSISSSWLSSSPSRSLSSPAERDWPCPSCSRWPSPPSAPGTGRGDPSKTRNRFQWQTWDKSLYLLLSLRADDATLSQYKLRWRLSFDRLLQHLRRNLRQKAFLLQSVSIALDWRRNVFNVELAFQECERHKPRILSNCRRGKYLRRKANKKKEQEKDRTHFILNQVLQFESTLPPKSAFHKPPHFHFLENWAWHPFLWIMITN